MPQEPLTSEEIRLRNREDRFIQESKKAYERIDRIRAVVEEARKERAKKVQAETQATEANSL